jgi:hypothetical protein
VFDHSIEQQLPPQHAQHQLMTQRSVCGSKLRFFGGEKNRRESAGFDLLEDLESDAARR